MAALSTGLRRLSLRGCKPYALPSGRKRAVLKGALGLRETEKGRSPMPLQTEQSVLVVDDEPTIVSLITAWLDAAGYKVAGTARDGKEGLERFRESNRVDLVISDVLMPHQNGPDMIHEMLREAPDLKVLFVTGYTDRTVEERIGELPFEVIRKPFIREHFLARVRDTLR